MSQPKPPNREAAQLIAWAANLGWECNLVRKHIRFKKDGFPPVFTSRSPSDHHAYANAKAMIKRLERANATK